MANVLINEDTMTDIADAIRSKKGVSTTYKPSDMPSAIESISSGGVTPTGTINITTNGTHDVTNYASANVAVPQGTTPTGTINITANGTHDVTNYASANVNVQGSAENDAIANVLKIIGNEAFRYETLPEIVNFKKLTSVGTRAFANVKGCKVLVLPAVTYLNTFPFSDSATITTIDLGAYSGGITQYSFSGNTNFDTLILRSSPNCTLATINVFDGTPFASNGKGGTLYVPQALIGTYQSASNWSTILGYTNNKILPIEGSIYETQYADGTPIS